MSEDRLAHDKVAENVVRIQVVSASAGETRRLGRCLGALLRPGDLLFLIGPFGAGKTTLTQGIARALGIRGPVTSPSFTLVNEYRTSDRLKGPILYHIDLFRISGADEAYGMGIEEYISGHAICVVEWPEQVSGMMPEDRLEIRMAFLGNTGRKLELIGRGCRHAELVSQFEDRCAPMTLGEGNNR